MPLLLLLVPTVLPQMTQPHVPEVWSKQLEEYAAQVAKTLSHPIEWNLPGRHQQWWDFRHCLRLASVWSHPRFRSPLLKLLDGEDPGYALSAAEALLNYQDADIRERVARLKDDTRKVEVLEGLHLPLGKLIDYYRSRKPERAGFDVVPDQLLPDTVFRYPVEDRTRTLPQAVQALQHEHLSIRLQGFMWLVQFGLVLDAAPLLQGWPELKTEKRVRLLESMFWIRSGEGRLRTALERILTEHQSKPLADAELGELLLRLSELHSDAVRDAALEIIARRGKTETKVKRLTGPGENPDILVYAFRAFGDLAQAEDIDRALAWSRSTSEAIRMGGLYALAGMDDPRAFDAVMEYVREGDGSGFSLELIDPRDALLDREWPDAQYRWRYLRAVHKALNDLLASYSAKGADAELDGYPVFQLICLLNDIAETRNGDDGWVITDDSESFSLKEARQTAANWTKWLQANDPQRARLAP